LERKHRHAKRQDDHAAKHAKGCPRNPSVDGLPDILDCRSPKFLPTAELGCCNIVTETLLAASLFSSGTGAGWIPGLFPEKPNAVLLIRLGHSF